jgi:hypothetical protein
MQFAFKIKGQQVGVKLDSFPSMLFFALVAGAAIGACFIAIGIAVVLLAALCVVLGGSLIGLGLAFVALILAVCAAGFVLWLIFIGLKRFFKEASRFFTVVVFQKPGTPPSPNSPSGQADSQQSGTSTTTSHAGQADSQQSNSTTSGQGDVFTEETILAASGSS